MLILGIETSCDETSIALVEAKAGRLFVRKNLVASQIKIHQKYGGVVPEVAARHHVEIIAPLLVEALKGIKPKDIDAIAATAGPGLVTALLVGVETARALAHIWKKPLIAVNHLAGHIYANWLQPVSEIRNPKSEIRNKSQISNFKFPILVLIVSGGHTELVLMSAKGGSAFGGKNSVKYKIIGQTRDDAAGECFDKVAKILGLAYPGGPEISRRAKLGNPQAINFPRPMIDSPDFDFSFSGLKTAVLYYIREQKKQLNNSAINNICASFEQAAVDVLVHKTVMAAQELNIKTIMLGGGVAANRHLQEQLGVVLKKQIPNTKYFVQDTQYYADNAAMIAAAGYFQAQKKDFTPTPKHRLWGFTPWQKIDVDPNWELQ